MEFANNEVLITNDGVNRVNMVDKRIINGQTDVNINGRGKSIWLLVLIIGCHKK